MNAVASKAVGEIEVLRHHAKVTHQVVKLGIEGVTHEESLIRPAPTVNCANWIMGHLVCVYDQVMPRIGQKPVMAPGALKKYERGSLPLENPAEALPLSELASAWDEASSRIDAGFAGLTPEVLDAPVAKSPTNNPNETVRTLLTTVLFHQAYHAGQLGILRRFAGKKGAIG